MFYTKKELTEIFFLKHRNDTGDFRTNENNVLDKSLSPYLFKNNTINAFLKKLQKIIYLFFDQNNVVRNFKNPTVDKYEFRHLD